VGRDIHAFRYSGLQKQAARSGLPISPSRGRCPLSIRGGRQLPRLPLVERRGVNSKMARFCSVSRWFDITVSSARCFTGVGRYRSVPNIAAAVARRERIGRGFDTAGATTTNVTPTSDLVRHTTRQSRAWAPPRESSSVNSSGKVATFGAVMPAPVFDKLCTMQGSVTGTPWNRIRADVFHSTRDVFRRSGRRGMALSHLRPMPQFKNARLTARSIRSYNSKQMQCKLCHRAAEEAETQGEFDWGS
jgi:hypothetical protein